MSAHASADHAADLPGFGLERPAPTPARLGHWAAFYLGMPLLLAIPLGWYGAGLASQAGFRCFLSVADLRRHVEQEVLMEAAA